MTKLLPLLVLCAAPALAEERVFPFDPVELVYGSEVAGSPEHTLVRGRFTYRFASAESRAVFEKDPATYEIQLGGGCARMGPLSGVGSTDIYTVYDGQIYIFASEQCRAGFLRAPEELLPSADARPTSDEDAQARGLTLLRRALEGMGGTRALDALTSYAQREQERVEHDGSLYDTGEALRIDFAAGAVTLTSWWGDWQSDAMVTSERSYMEVEDETFEMHPAQIEAVRRRARVNPLSVLAARKRADFVAWAAGEERLGDEAVQLLGCWFDGTRVVLAIDARGRVRSARFRERGPSMAFGEVRIDFSDFEVQAGVPVARTHTATFDGAPYERWTRTFATVAVVAAE